MDGKPFTMELDAGVTVSLVSESTYQEYWPDRQVQECNCKTRLSTYSGEPLSVLGTLVWSKLARECPAGLEENSPSAG